MNLIITLGCNKVTNGHIDTKVGIFGVLDERFRKILLGKTIPARENTDCAHRRSAQCNVDCLRARTGYQSDWKVSWQQKGRRM